MKRLPRKKYSGFMYYRGYIDPDGIITDALLSSNHLVIDWDEDGDVGHLEAETADGASFEGTMTYEPSGERHRYALRLFRSNEDILLFGTWFEPVCGEEGRWTILLTPK